MYYDALDSKQKKKTEQRIYACFPRIISMCMFIGWISSWVFDIM